MINLKKFWMIFDSFMKVINNNGYLSLFSASLYAKKTAYEFVDGQLGDLLDSFVLASLHKLLEMALLAHHLFVTTLL